MCLRIKKGARQKIAKSDIECYKFVRGVKVISRDSVKHGSTFSGYINNIKCTGQIAIVNDEMFFCTNESALNGVAADDKLGYPFSWKFDAAVSLDNLLINDGESYNSIYSEFRTPYQKTLVKIGETYSSELIKVEHEFSYNACVEIGLHSFAELNEYNNSSKVGLVACLQLYSDAFVVKCIIPKGSKYFEGTFNDGKSYASDTITYVEIIDFKIRIMCLYLKGNPEVKIAKKDIVCYKYVETKFEFHDSKDKFHGKSFRATIKDIPCEGIISIIDDEMYFCHDISRLEGSNAPYKFDCKYSWVLDDDVKSIEIDGEPLDLELYKILRTPYRDVQVKIGETYTSKLLKNNPDFDGNCRVDFGLHSFAKIDDCYDIGGCFRGNLFIECIIPKGSKYYVGRFNGDGYASDKLTYVELVKK